MHTWLCISRRLAVSLLAAGLATGCGRSLTAPLAPAPSAQATAPAGASLATTDATSGRVVATLADGVDAATLAAQYGATVVVSLSNDRTVSLLPAPGQSPATLESALSVDPRVVTAEPDAWLE